MSRARAAARIPVALVCLALGLTPACATSSGPFAAGSARRSEVENDLLARWNQIPPAELETIWSEAQNTAGIVAVEPLSHDVGAQAANKKAWGFADDLYKLFAGKAPIWFPADLVRHTVCGGDGRWSYFWWIGSGPERDLHPWLGHKEGFEHLVGPHGAAITSSRVLDLAECSEVGGAAGEPCLYGEVTAPDRFEEWFCGKRGGTCRARLVSDATDVPAGFSRPEQLCFLGPWVIERVHSWRPEIHPAEVLWTRPHVSAASWRVALVPDDSGRFDAAKHYAPLAGGVTPKPWARNRPVELWVGFSFDPQAGLAFDLAVDDLRPGPRKAQELKLPAVGGAFERLTAPGVLLVAARTWRAASDARTRGLLVLRTDIRADKRQPVLLGVTGRAPQDPPTAWPFPPRVERREVALRAVEAAPGVRLLPFNRVRAKADGRYEVEVQARFDPQHPSAPQDEQQTDRLNEALGKRDSDRRRVFGKERPFTIVWSLEAFRADCTTVPIALADPGAGRPDAVVAAARRGEATEAVAIEGAGPPRERDEFRGVVTLGELSLRVPAGVTVSGRGTIRYTGTPIGLTEASVPVRFSLPGPAQADEWDLLRDVLTNLDAPAAPERLRTLQADACAPFAAPCSLDEFARQAGPRIADPVSRWSARREIDAPDRTFARFVRQMAVAFRWDREVDYDEYARLWRLLAATYEPGRRAAGADPEPRCR